MTLNTPRSTSLIFSALILSLAAVIFVPAARAQSSTVRAPKGTHVLLDGKVEANEWRDAARLKAADDFDLYLKQSGGFLYVALKPAAQRRFLGVNIYFGRNEQAPFLNMHASAKLGERQLSEKEIDNANWPEWKTWWNNTGWAANVVRIDDWAARTFVAEEGKEFQIRLDTLGSKQLSLAVDHEDNQGVHDLIQWAPKKHGKHWLTIRL